MSDYLVDVMGCDDSTHAIVDLTPAEVLGFEKVMWAINARSIEHCQPTLRIRAVATVRHDDYDLQRAQGIDPYDFAAHEGELT